VGVISYIISLAVVGLIIGGLGRLIVPGPNRIGLLRTLGVGLVGAIVGAIVGGILGLGVFSIVLELAVSAGLVYLVSNRGGRNRRIVANRHW
jgi:uncharacterized membrane protein YeaQ/YmgE (transglycosylase-associated protein family)